MAGLIPALGGAARRQSRPLRWVALVSVMALVALVLPSPSARAWVVPNGQSTEINTSVFYPSFPDPAAVGVGTSGVQLYSTNSGGYIIPSATWDPGHSDVSSTGDALAAPPAGVPTDKNWAPDVAYIQGQYVMWFAASSNGNPACLYVAYASDPTWYFTLTGQAYCDMYNPAFGLFDPYLWSDGKGDWWILYAQEDSSKDTANDVILARSLTPNGLTFSGASETQLTYADVASRMITPVGDNPYIENPAYAVDPRGIYPYQLTVSYGTWNQSDFINGEYVSDYATTIVGCYTFDGCGPFNPSEMQEFNGQMTGGDPSIENSGGATFVQSSPVLDDYYLIYAAAPANTQPPGPRQPYFDVTNADVLSPGESIQAGTAIDGVPYCVCDENGWRLVMQTDGNLVIYDQNNVARWGSGTSGDGNTFAVMQSDGNFVVYDNGVALWGTGTGVAGSYLDFQNSDGNLVVYSPSGAALWGSGT